MRNLFEKFNSLNILIIGDVMMDSYLWGKVERISPEAPVPVVSVRKKENRLGGAANVALNIQALGATPWLCSVIGDDMEGQEFCRLLDVQSMPRDGIVTVPGRPTTVKTRVIGQNQQIVRVDAEDDRVVRPETTELLLKKVSDIISGHPVSVIIFEDYDKGVITEELIREVVRIAGEHGIPTIVDPKKRNFLCYRDVTLFKPNLKELREGLKVDVDAGNTGEIEEAVTTLQERLGARQIMVTLSERGVYISSENGKKLIPAHIRDIADVSGAGDTVIATTAVCMASGFDEFMTAAIANLAGGLVCEYVGVVPINKEQLLAEALKL
ncbi:MAG TPA: bifunctional ADP-heptose synthase [Sphingobacteriaceae bacterium]